MVTHELSRRRKMDVTSRPASPTQDPVLNTSRVGIPVESIQRSDSSWHFVCSLCLLVGVALLPVQIRVPENQSTPCIGCSEMAWGVEMLSVETWQLEFDPHNAHKGRRRDLSPQSYP